MSSQQLGSSRSFQMKQEPQNNDQHQDELEKYKKKSTTLSGDKWKLFPTINVLPKSLQEVEKYYKSVTHLDRSPKVTLSDDQFQQMRKALESKIALKKKEGLELKRQESRVRWAIEREVRFKQKLQEEKRLRDELADHDQQVLINFIKRKKDVVLKRLTDMRSTSQNRLASERKKQPQQLNPEQPAKKKSKRSLSQRLRAEKQMLQLEKLKAQLREECVNVLKREDNLNSYLMSFRD